VNRRQYAFPAAILAVALIAGIVVLIANSGGDSGSSGKGGCDQVPAPPARPVERRPKPKLRLDPSETYKATVETNCGTFVIALDAKQAPITGGSFVSLARAGFYDGLGFHRIAPGFVIQGGDPSGDGTGGPGYKVHERPPKDVAYTRGTVAMAKGGAEPAGTSGSQFFVVSGPNAATLPPDYAIVGNVTSGMDTVKRIDGFGDVNDPSGTPTRPVVVESVTVEES
jgi:peptidyl-prolyl cis-trans isomerase B (cyclophilin B)